MSQACIWGMSARLFRVFYKILKVLEAGADRCAVCGEVGRTIASAEAVETTIGLEGLLCPPMVERLSEEQINRPMSPLHMWCDKGYPETTRVEIKFWLRWT